ncbi:copper resistance protein [Trinickia symbiotica]|uniref:Copper resistance protein n=1 Tax=Trinickia symbiotica TaxID=863227 RepID=A0A2T3XKF8_9BURK|nr:copper resistance protein CopC [Trinickia symbiotica]PTB17018.1 copper resistance protein [Trinickia symbiotica]
MPQFKRLRRGSCAVAIAIGILTASSAFAHVFPQTQTPPAGAEVAAPPNVTIVFDGTLEPTFSSLTVSNSTGKQVNTAKSAIDPNDKKSISVAPPALPPDKYTVYWVAVASDGHRTHGDYSFRVK